ERLRHSAHHDPLTGLANRVLFEARFTRMLARSARDDRPWAVLFIDLDGFKAINDEKGHAVGDAVLREVADRLQQVCREQDIVARLGGDEFLIASAGVPLAEAGALAERVRAAVSAPLSGD